MFNVRTTSTIAAIAGVALVLSAMSTGVASAGNDALTRSEVARIYVDELVPALDESIGWTGSVDGCDAGGMRSAAQSATKTAVNAVRELAGLDPVRFAAKYNSKAQEAALVYMANSDITHTIPKSWECYSSSAREAGEKSNIAFGLGGASAITAYMQDYGDHNLLVGHRRWILYPQTTVMGSGSTEITNALWVLGDTASKGDYANPSWVSWPTAGYFPSQLEPDGRWSLSGDSTHDYDFSRAKVAVTNSAGKRLSVKVRAQHKEIGYGNDTLVWEVPGVNSARGTQVREYDVSVTGIRRDGKTVSRSYSVKLFDPVAWVADHPSN